MTNVTPAFLAACKREPVPHTPIWVMRQAGRYLPEYRAVRERVDFQTLTKTPDLAAEVTLQPIRRFGMDAAILFSDIMTPVEGMGVDIEFAPGPVIADPIRSAAAVDKLRVPDPKESVPFVLETVEILARELPDNVPLIGFAGAPFTLFCYLVEGKGTKTFTEARAFLYREPEAASKLLDLLAETMGEYLLKQAEAGARALMVFDSWAGLLSPRMYDRFARPAVDKVLNVLKQLDDVPLIYFPNGGATIIPSLANLEADVVALDWRVSLSWARQVLGDVAVQGNLDPAALFATRDELAQEIDNVLEDAGSGTGHIFNLGHGIERTTDPDAVAFLVDRVHERTAR